MNKLPCESCKGLCCGPVPITEKELKAIKKKVRTMPQKRKTELQSQMRFHGTCIFYDLDKDRCGIYLARPEVCSEFGHHKNLTCILAPEVATKEDWNSKDDHIGLLSVDFTWKDFK